MSWISISDRDNSSTVGLVREDIPFAIIVARHLNHGKEPVIVKQGPVFRGNVALFEQTENVKILGTGGLTKPGKQIGSYMWLAAADPESRNGIVAGFRTTDRGSGVVFAEEKEKQLQIEAQRRISAA